MCDNVIPLLGIESGSLLLLLLSAELRERRSLTPIWAYIDTSIWRRMVNLFHLIAKFITDTLQ